MTHPIFRAGEYPWWRDEARTLHRLLFETFFERKVVERLYQSSGEGLPPLFTEQAVNLLWQDALEQLARAGRLRQLTELVLTESAGPTLAEAIAAVAAAQPAVHAVVVPDGPLVLDRQPLRALLDQVGTNDHPTKVVLVRGHPKSGKTYGKYLFERAARDQGAEPVYLSAGVMATVDEAVLLLFTLLGADEGRIPPRDTTDAAWYRAVGLRMLQVAREQNKVFWIAVDDLGLGPDGVPLMDAQIRMFFEQFATLLLTVQVAKWFRLMLIHYPEGPGPTGWSTELSREDRLDEADVTPADVVTYLRGWAAGRVRGQLTDDHLDGIAAEIIAAATAPPAGPTPRPRLQVIHEALLSKLRDLELAGP